MDIKKKSNLIIFLIILAIILSIFVINYFKNITNGDERVLKCIADKSKLYVTKTCSHCANQKLILGEGLQYFTLVDCTENPLECLEINGLPTWEIDGEFYRGVKSIEQLKELTGC